MTSILPQGGTLVQCVVLRASFLLYQMWKYGIQQNLST